MKYTELINEKQVESAWILDISLNRPNRVATMKLSNGNVYLVRGITRYMFDRWHRAPSKGAFYHAYIKNRFPIEKIW
jgi:hypothetical protein